MELFAPATSAPSLEGANKEEEASIFDLSRTGRQHQNGPKIPNKFIKNQSIWIINPGSNGAKGEYNYYYSAEKVIRNRRGNSPKGITSPAILRN